MSTEIAEILDYKVADISLAEFGRKNQVLLFTHLDRDRELAEELDSELAEVKCLERLAL